MSHNPPFHVVFGAGPLGLSVVDALLARGKSVRVVTRSGKADVPAGVEVVRADAYQIDQVEPACRDAEVVYQCAQPPYHRWVQEFPALQRNILAAAAKAGALVVIAENLYMYGEVDGVIHERLPYKAATRKGRVRAQMSAEALQAHNSGKLKVTLARASDFFGPRVLNSTLGERVFVPAVNGKSAMPVGCLDLPHTYTYIKDFGRAMVILGEHPQAAGEAWHVPNAEALTQREIVTKIFALLERPAKINPTGRMMMQIGGLFIPEARESVEMMYEFERPFIVDSRKFSQTFGIYATPIDIALEETVKWYCAAYELEAAERITRAGRTVTK